MKNPPYNSAYFNFVMFPFTGSMKQAIRVAIRIREIITGARINSIMRSISFAGETKFVPRNKIASKGLMIKAPRYAPMVPMREKFTFPSQSSFLIH